MPTLSVLFPLGIITVLPLQIINFGCWFDVHLGSVTKRGTWEFGLLILRIAGRNPLLYTDYGCYCGKGGRGKPVDATDRYVREYQPIKAETQSQNAQPSV